ncbi:MAG: orotidine-5'-phosphate decarboxylase [Candidatus Paceibacterota bacterium]|jgi:orotidine-5'-phosphate decarboxylase
MNPIEKYNQRAKKINSLLCVGLDADFEKLPEKFKSLDGSEAQFQFNKYIIDLTHEFVASFKPNVAFYEARGTEGMEALKKTMDYLHEKYPDIFTILDAKRADIGNTNNGYVTSIFDWLGFDAMTINPYLGKEAIQPFLDRKDKASIILCRTSNSGAGEFQDLKSDGKYFWEIVAGKVSKEWNQNKNCLLVVGATYPEEMKKIREIVGEMTFLVPGIGVQGGDVKSVVINGLNKKKLGLIINSSRGIIFSENPAEEAKKLRDEINLYR